MNSYLGYLRVSTQRQGHGVSLPEQREAIERYAAQHNLTIAEWFEEHETAAKRGRPVFARMLRLLVQRKAAGVIVHKIDRSARNHWDWAEINELIDRGFGVHFAGEPLDLHSGSGRLAADIQAAFAVHYIRNLREEVKKGLYGRLKQGVYPFRAPLGFLDRGGGKPKEVDPTNGPLMQQAFELCGTGRFSLETLSAEMYRRGLRSRNGGRVTRTVLAELLHNPFYAGVIRIRRTGQLFPAIHTPLIPKVLFERVQAVLSGKAHARVIVHEFAFRRLLRCATCMYSLVGETHKGFTYYRCHTRSHPVTSVREDVVEGELRRVIAPLALNHDEHAYARRRLDLMSDQGLEARTSYEEALKLRVQRVETRQQRLTDALLDGVIDKDTFEQRRAALLMERRQIEADQAKGPLDPAVCTGLVLQHLELGMTASSQYNSWTTDERRDFIQTVTSNRMAQGRNVVFTLQEPFLTVAGRSLVGFGRPHRDVPRTMDPLIAKLWNWYLTNIPPIGPKIQTREELLALEDEEAA
jgi:DNA invertase Pin-like site-specific DNA recombinase